MFFCVNQEPIIVQSYLPAVRNGCWQSGALDHEGSTGIVGEQCEAVALDLGTLRCVELPGAVDRE